MTVEVQLFAGARAAAGSGRATVSLLDGASVGDLRRELVAMAPGLGRYGTAIWIAINGEYAADHDAVPPVAEIACFPPVSGG